MPLLGIPALSPLYKVAAIVVLVAGGYLYGRLHESRSAAEKLNEFTAQVAAQAAEQAKRTAARIKAQQQITLTKEFEYAETLRAALDSGWRDRVRLNALARGVRVPAVSVPAAVADGAATHAMAAGSAPPLDGAAEAVADVSRAYWTLAEECTRTTAMLTTLQAWARAQEER
jgi:hypothetical protein